MTCHSGGTLEIYVEPHLPKPLLLLVGHGPVIETLATLAESVVEEHRNALFLGPPGVGKSHLAIALGIAATEAGYRTYFTTAADLVGALSAAHLEGSWTSKMRTYTGPSVLVIDELGYLPMDATSAHWIFQGVPPLRAGLDRADQQPRLRRLGSRCSPTRPSPRRSSTVLLPDATVVNIKGSSYRMRAHVPSSEGGRRYARLTLIASALFAAISLHVSRSLTPRPRPVDRQGAGDRGPLLTPISDP